MFIYDKDMERVMMAKKKEVLQEIETAKLRVLKELYCIKRGIHTDMCEMLADYNRIDFNLKKAIKDAETKLEITVKEFQRIIADALEEHNRTIETKLNELSSLQSSVISEVNAALSDLDAMKSTVENLIVQCQELIENGVTQADLDELRTQLEAAIATAGVQSDWDESDETSKAFILNKPFYALEGDAAYSVNSLYYHETEYSVQTSTFYIANYSCRFYLRIVQDTTAKLAEYGPFTPQVIDGEIVLAQIEDEGFILKITGDLTSTGEKWRQRLTYTNTKYNPADGHSYNLEITDYAINYVRPDPQLLGKNAGVRQYLRLNKDYELEWDSRLLILSPNGTPYKITVTDDGVLSATAVTE